MSEDQHSSATTPAKLSLAMEQTINTLAPICQDNPVAMCITDSHARLYHANQAFLDLLESGPELEAIKGHSLNTLFSQHSHRVIDFIESIIKDGRCLSLQKILHTGAEHMRTPMKIHVQQLADTTSQAKDGVLISLQEDASWYRAQFDEDKKILTTRIHQLSTDLMDRQALIKTLMEHSPFGIALMDRQRRIIQINRTAEKILNIPRSEARGILCNNLFQCFEREQRCPILEDGNNIDQQETTCAQHGKKQNTFLRSAVLSRERNEDIIIEAFIDITEMKGAQEAQEVAYRAKDDFFAKMSHELRTPLNAVIGYSELLSDDSYPLAPGELKEYAGAIQRGGYDLLHLVDQVLDMARINENKVNTEPQELHPTELINEIKSTIQPLAEKNLNQLTCHCANDVGTVYADPEHLRAILLNLLSNACKFTKQGEVNLNVERESGTKKDWIVFHISDTGIGLTEGEIQRVFNRFEQADNSATRSYGGSGLGLPIVKGLTEIMNGIIDVESTPGQGSTFTVRLPGEHLTKKKK